ncbi:MAG: DUF1924 domain-containing protein [Betaproteobacteria bacterium]
MLGFLLASSAAAEFPAEMVARYAADAAKAQPGYVPSAAAGREFFLRRFDVSAELPGCATCHTENPAARGKHAITGKRIAPLAPSANLDRFTDGAHVEKWFKRNCTEIVGRECTAAEKANFVSFLLTVRP